MDDDSLLGHSSFETHVTLALFSLAISKTVCTFSCANSRPYLAFLGTGEGPIASFKVKVGMYGPAEFFLFLFFYEEGSQLPFLFVFH